MFRYAEEVLRDLRCRYKEPHRHYHNYSHIREMFEMLEALEEEGLVKQSFEIELAIWYHDAIYDPSAAKGENEKASDRLFRQHWSRYLSDDVRWRVSEMILMTIDHRATNPYYYNLIFLDLDLMRLGASSGQFIINNKKIEMEYAPVIGVDTFRQGSKKFMEEFAKRDAIFHTEWFSDRYEKQARMNLAIDFDKIWAEEARNGG